MESAGSVACLAKKNKYASESRSNGSEGDPWDALMKESTVKKAALEKEIEDRKQKKMRDRRSKLPVSELFMKDKVRNCWSGGAWLGAVVAVRASNLVDNDEEILKGHIILYTMACSGCCRLHFVLSRCFVCFVLHCFVLHCFALICFALLCFIRLLSNVIQ